MKGLIVMGLALFLVFPLVAAEDHAVDLFFFEADGCPYCNMMDSFLIGLEGKYPELNVSRYEVKHIKENQAIFISMANAYDHQITGVPVVFIDDKVMAGVSDTLFVNLEDDVRRCVSEGCGSPIAKLSKVSGNSTEVTGDATPIRVFRNKTVQLLVELAFVVVVVIMLLVWIRRSKRNSSKPQQNI